VDRIEGGIVGSRVAVVAGRCYHHQPQLDRVLDRFDADIAVGVATGIGAIPSASNGRRWAGSPSLRESVTTSMPSFHGVRERGPPGRLIGVVVSRRGSENLVIAENALGATPWMVARGPVFCTPAAIMAMAVPWPIRSRGELSSGYRIQLHPGHVAARHNHLAVGVIGIALGENRTAVSARSPGNPA